LTKNSIKEENGLIKREIESIEIEIAKEIGLMQSGTISKKTEFVVTTAGVTETFQDPEILKRVAKTWVVPIVPEGRRADNSIKLAAPIPRPLGLGIYPGK
jgi:hypothetical protein